MGTTDEPRAYTQIAYDRDGPVAIITLDRPDRLNAYTTVMLAELLDVLDRTDADDGVRAVVFTGRGRAFCAGADLEAGGETFPGGSEEYDHARDADTGGVLTQRLFASRKPLIAAINGAAVGVGATMTLPMDVRLAGEDARIGFVFTRRGLVPEACSSWFLPRVVGISRATEWVFSGRLVPADEARESGLVRDVHPADELLAAAIELGREMAAASAPVAVAISRAMLWRMLGEHSPADAHEIDSRMIYALGRTGDVIEGVESFQEKRAPSFPMRLSEDVPALAGRWLAHTSVAEFLAAERERS